ncbi:MAG: phage tail tube protein [Patescibacteria group bacterium]
MTLHSEQSARVTLSLMQQATWGTRLVDGSMLYSYPMRSANPGKRLINFFNNQDEIGKGHSFPTRLDVETYDYTRRLEFDLDTFTLGWACAFAMGDYAVTGPTDSAYTHTNLLSLLADDDGQLPFTTIVEELDSDGGYYPDIVVEGFDISGTIGQRPVLGIDLVGSGRKVALGAFAHPTLASANFLKWTGLTPSWGEAGSEVSIADRLRSFKFSVKNNLDVTNAYIAGAGGYKGQCLYGLKRDVTLELTFVRSGVTEITALEAYTEMGAILAFEGGNIGAGSTPHAATITMPSIQIIDVEPSFDAKLGLYTPTLVPLYDSDSQGPVSIEVVNDVAAYLTSEA